MFIKNGKRFNIYIRYTDPNTGESGIDMSILANRLKYNVQEIPDPIRESDETHYNQETDESPYILCTPKPPDLLAKARWEKLKTIRDELIENGGCFVSNKWFHSDVRSKQQQIALVMLGSNIPANLNWKTMDGSLVTMTETLAGQIFMAQIAREQEIFNIAETKKNDTSIIASGWPARYQEV